MHLAALSDSWTWHEISGGSAHLGGGSQLIGSWDLGLIGRFTCAVCKSQESKIGEKKEEMKRGV